MIPAPTQGVKQVHVMALPNGVDSIIVDMEAIDTAWVTAMTSLGERIEERVRRWSVEEGGPEVRPEATRDVFRAHQYAATGRFADASRVLEDVLSDDPTRTPAWDLLLRSRVGLGDLDGALRTASAWSRSGSEGAPSSEEVRELAAAIDGDGTEGYWEWTLQRLEARENDDPAPRMAFATAHAALENEEEAFTYLVAALERGEPGIFAIRSDPAWDNVRSDPEFRELGRQAQQMMYSRSRPPGGRPPR
jgi:hypothetical protein